jgi:hypothetical protein
MASKPICIRQPGPQSRVGMGRRSRIERCRSQGILHKGKHRPLDNWLNAGPNFRLDDRNPNLLGDFRVAYKASLKLQPPRSLEYMFFTRPRGAATHGMQWVLTARDSPRQADLPKQHSQAPAADCSQTYSKLQPTHCVTVRCYKP